MRTCLIFSLFFMLVASCAPTIKATKPVIVLSPTSTFLPTSVPTLTSSPSPTPTVQPTLDFQAYDLRWCISDNEGDVGIPYLDVVKIDAIARGETFIVRIFVKNIPELITFNRPGIPKDKLEYSWDIWIDLDGDAKEESADFDSFTDYDLAIMHFVSSEDETKTLSLADGTQQNIWQSSPVDSTWVNVGDAKVEFDRPTGTITLIGNIPGLNPNSKIAFSTYDFNPGHEEQQEDQPDSPNMVPPNKACS